MNDPAIPQDFVSDTSRKDDGLPCEDVPQFGAVDIVEAFTAMRHEWRGQTRESRDLAEQIRAAVTNIQQLESKLLAVAGDRPDDTPESRQLAMLIAETEHPLSRAVAAAAQWESGRQRRAAEIAKTIDECAAGMNGLARWFARPLLALLAGQNSAREPAEENPALEGLSMVLARLRRMMQEREIERFDVLGLPFDPEAMHAIGTMTSADFPAGHVGEQISPAYRWRGELLRFADVRVADQNGTA
jgi:molecular chaperone GrpE